MFADILRHELRIKLLQILLEMPRYYSNSTLLCAIAQREGHETTRDQVKGELRWLSEQGLARLTEADSVLVATLTERGQDVAEGRARVAGVARPKA